MFYTIYKITNVVNGKVYIGKHQTNNIDDGYMGSGKLIRRAIEKYGIENFEKEILFKFSTEEEMNTKEAELVTEEFCDRKDTYNLCPGGHGGFGYLNSNKLSGPHTVPNFHKMGGKSSAIDGKNYKRLRAWHSDPENKEHFLKSLKGLPSNFKGKTHTEETKAKMRKPKNQGSKNPQFGTMWITNGTENKKIKKVDEIPEGWYKGRKIKNEPYS